MNKKGVTKSIYRICKDCGWVHFGVTLDFAINAVNNFNKFFAGLSRERQIEDYGGRPASLMGYMHCSFCGHDYTHFRVAKAKEVPFGSTLSPIIYEKRKK